MPLVYANAICIHSSGESLSFAICATGPKCPSRATIPRLTLCLGRAYNRDTPFVVKQKIHKYGYEISCFIYSPAAVLPSAPPSPRRCCSSSQRGDSNAYQRRVSGASEEEKKLGYESRSNGNAFRTLTYRIVMRETSTRPYEPRFEAVGTCEMQLFRSSARGIGSANVNALRPRTRLTRRCATIPSRARVRWGGPADALYLHWLLHDHRSRGERGHKSTRSSSVSASRRER